MADSFQGSDNIRIQPGDTNIPYQFNFKAATSSNRADGALPFGSTLTSVAVTAHHGFSSQSVAAGNLVHAATDFSYSSNYATVPLTYSTGLINNEIYHLEIVVTATINGVSTNVMKREFDFDRVLVRD